MILVYVAIAKYSDMKQKKYLQTFESNVQMHGEIM